MAGGQSPEGEGRRGPREGKLGAATGEAGRKRSDCRIADTAGIFKMKGVIPGGRVCRDEK